MNLAVGDAVQWKTIKICLNGLTMRINFTLMLQWYIQCVINYMYMYLSNGSCTNIQGNTRL
jgi:hypothetical protein